MTISQFDKTTLSAIRTATAEALKTVEEKFGIKMQLGNISFNEKSFTSKITATVNDSTTGESVSPDFITLQKYSHLYLPSTFDINKTYKHPRLGDVKVVGLNTRRHQYPFIIKQLSSGKQYKFDELQTKALVM